LRSTRDRKNIPLIAQTIRKFSPHLLGVQEIDGGSRRNSHYDQIKVLSQSTGMMHRHQAMEKTTLGYLYDGNALLSKIPFERVDHKTLPHNLKERNFIFAEIIANNKRVLVITTHLAAYSVNAEERSMQVSALCAFIKKIKMPVILLGDFNCAPDTEEFSLFINCGLKSLITKPTYPTYLPTKIYDNILVSQSIKVRKARVLPANLSDHFAAYAEVEI
jgi:endonuclease/exonuclease/phosphatase family metal-dependent hydrolase